MITQKSSSTSTLLSLTAKQFKKKQTSESTGLVICNRPLTKEILEVSNDLLREINASIYIKNIPNYQSFFYPIEDYVNVVKEPTQQEGLILTEQPPKKRMILIVRRHISYYPFLSYFQLYRYYVNIIETYRSLVESIQALQSENIVFNGFLTQSSEAIIITADTKTPYLNNFKSAIKWKRVFPDLVDVFSGVHLDNPMVFPPSLFLWLYMYKNDIKVLREIDKVTILGSYSTPSMEQLLFRLGTGRTKEDICRSLFEEGLVWTWDIYSLTYIYRDLCKNIENKNRYFGNFMTMLEDIIDKGGESPIEVFIRLNQIVM